jgi:small GTP-binding protein
MEPAFLKLVILGSANVGKTSFVNYYCTGFFSEEIESTVGASFYTRPLTVANSEVNVQFWDTAGQERFRSVVPALLRGAQGAILVFDVTDPASFQDLDDHLHSFLEASGFDATATVPVLLLGNKTDLGAPAVDDPAIGEWRVNHRVPLYFPVSAKLGTNVHEAVTAFLEFVVPRTTLREFSTRIELQGEREEGGCCW